MIKKTIGTAFLVVLALLAAFLLFFTLGEPSAIGTLGGIAAGFAAWCFPIWQLTLARKSRPGICTAASLSLGMICLLLEFSYLVYKAQIRDWAAIEDTAAALFAVAVIYTAITVGLNILMLILTNKEERT